MLFANKEEQFKLPVFKMDYYSPKEYIYVDQRPFSFQVGDSNCYNTEKMKKKSHYLFKDSMDTFNDYNSELSSKAYSNVSTSILSYIVGGFVGSKSQMNNNKKHNLSYDLGAAISNLLNHWKCENDKALPKKNSEIFNEVSSKIHPECYEKYITSKPSQKKYFLTGIPLQNYINCESHVLNCNKECEKTSCYENQSIHKQQQNYDKNLNAVYGILTSEVLSVEKGNNNIIEHEFLPEISTNKEISVKVVPQLGQDEVQASMNLVNLTKCNLDKNMTVSDVKVGSGIKNVGVSKSVDVAPEMKENSKLFNNEKNKTEATKSMMHFENSNLTSDAPIQYSLLCDISKKSEDNNNFDLVSENNNENARHSLSYCKGERFRKQSECSMDSTDSECFIVFEDDDNESNCQECETDGNICNNLAKKNWFIEDDFYEEDDEDDENEDGYSSNDFDEDEEECSENGDDSCDFDLLLVTKEVNEANTRWREYYNDDASKKESTPKKVKFNDNVKINKIVAWDHAYRQARLGPWEQIRRDRVRFQERISRLASIISPVLEKEHRSKIYRKFYS